MSTKEIALSFLKCIWENQNDDKIYHFLTKDTVFYSINEHKDIPLELAITLIEPYKDCEYRILESRVCVKVILYKESQTISLYFENVKRNHLTRLEIQ